MIHDCANTKSRKDTEKHTNWEYIECRCLKNASMKIVDKQNKG